MDDGEVEGLLLQGDRSGEHLHRADRAVGQPVGIDQVVHLPLLHLPDQPGDLVPRQAVDLAELHLPQGFPGIAVEARGRRVRVEDATAVRVDQEHDGAVLLEQLAEAVFTGLQGLDQLLALGDVPAHGLDLDQPPLVVEQPPVVHLDPADAAGGVPHPVLHRDHRFPGRYPRDRGPDRLPVLGHGLRMPGPAEQFLPGPAEETAEHLVHIGVGAFGRPVTAEDLGLILDHGPVAGLAGAQFLLVRPPLGDVPAGDGQPAVRAGKTADLQPAAGRLEKGLEPVRPAAVTIVPGCRQTIGEGGRHDLVQIAAEDRARLEPERPPGGLVEEQEPAGRVAGEEEVRDAVEDGGEWRLDVRRRGRLTCGVMAGRVIGHGSSLPAPGLQGIRANQHCCGQISTPGRRRKDLVKKPAQLTGGAWGRRGKAVDHQDRVDNDRLQGQDRCSEPDQTGSRTKRRAAAGGGTATGRKAVRRRPARIEARPGRATWAHPQLGFFEDRGATASQGQKKPLSKSC